MGPLPRKTVVVVGIPKESNPLFLIPIMVLLSL